MGILVECPACKYRNSPKKANCNNCGLALKKLAGKSYWIEYYDDSAGRKRERIGPSKAAAEQRYREVITARTEGRHIDRDLNAKVTLGELFDWYKELPDVKAKRTYRKELSLIRNLEGLLGSNTKIKDITPGRIEIYRATRLAAFSPRHLGKTVRPSSVNREITCLNGMLNRAVRHRKLQTNPIAVVRKLAEHNVRMRILDQDEFQRLLQACPGYIRPVVMLAYYTGMRKSEILLLTWDEVDLSKGFIRLHGDRTKTKEARSVPLPPELTDMIHSLPRGLHTNRVFLRNGKPLDDIKRAYQAACKKAGLDDFTFHDLRHCALNNLRKAGNDYFKIMAVSGHKTMSVFKRYNLVTEEELSTIKWGEVAPAKEQ